MYVDSSEKNCEIKPSHKRHNHSSGGSNRATAYKKYEYLKHISEFMDEYKLTKFDAYCRVNPMLTKSLGRGAETRNVSRWRRGEERKSERQQLEADASDAHMVFEGDDGEIEEVDTSLTEKEFNGIVNELRCLQAEDPDAYVCVRHYNLEVNYIFVARGWQRQQGRLFGEMKVTDDKHGVSSRRYHLATLGLVTNNGRLIPVAFALFDRPSTSNWKNFIEDAREAFAPEEGGFERKWEVTIADQAPCIAAAFDLSFTAEEGHQLDACLRHFLQLLADRHGSCRAFWQPIGEKMIRFLNSWRVWESDALEKEIEGDLREFPPEFDTVRDKLDVFFQSAKSRVLHKRSSFTYGWNSQSGAESIFSIVARMKVGSNMSLLGVVQRLLGLARNNETRSIDRRPGNINVGGELSKTAERLTPFAYDLFWEEYTAMVNYDISDCGDGNFRVARLTDERGNAHVVNTRGWECDCKYPVWKGMPCCHVLLVWLRDHKHYIHSDALFSSRWFRNQPACRLLHKSPALPGASATAADRQACSSTAEVNPNVIPGAGTRHCTVPMSMLPPLFIQSSGDEVLPSKPATLRAEVFSDFSDTLETIGNDHAKLQVAHALVQAVRTLTVSGGSVGDTQPRLPQEPSSIGRPSTMRKKGISERLRLGENLKKARVCSTCKATTHCKKTCPVELQRHRDVARKRLSERRSSVRSRNCDDESGNDMQVIVEC
eukprot:GHVU01052289.1.p1 GENE.GHVU01052289.1~~GHVU01052289.1.p1  ORF type:complete len:714 (-),score=39.55 GHVU01052289.1:9-2150(-)